MFWCVYVSKTENRQKAKIERKMKLLFWYLNELYKREGNRFACYLPKRQKEKNKKLQNKASNEQKYYLPK